jgi:hypothetical protein
MVTVGTAVASRPPYRSRRALLTQRAPPSGSGVEAVTGQRVYRSDWRKETGDELDEPLPWRGRKSRPRPIVKVDLPCHQSDVGSDRRMRKRCSLYRRSQPDIPQQT